MADTCRLDTSKTFTGFQTIGLKFVPAMTPKASCIHTDLTTSRVSTMIYAARRWCQRKILVCRDRDGVGGPSRRLDRAISPLRSFYPAVTAPFLRFLGEVEQRSIHFANESRESLRFAATEGRPAVAIVDERESTLLVSPGGHFEVAASGNIVVSIGCG